MFKLNNIKIRIKLLFAFGSLLVLSSILVVIFFQISNKINKYERLSESIDFVNIEILEMDANINHFMNEGYKSVEFQTTSKHFSIIDYIAKEKRVLSTLDTIHQSNLISDKANVLEMRTLQEQVSSNFKLQVGHFKHRGFKDYGLEGSLRKAIHDIENSAFDYDKSTLLMLRRNEKDFFIRKDLKYLDDFTKRLSGFKKDIEQSPSSTLREQTLTDLESYKSLFEAIVKTEIEIGLTETSGMKGLLASDLSKIKTSIQTLRSSLKKQRNHYQRNTNFILLGLFVAEVIIGILLAIFYSTILTNAIKELRNAMKVLSEGKFPQLLPVKSNEEIGETKKAFNQLLERMKVATHFSATLGEGKTNAEYDQRFKEDILAQALIKMQEKLKYANEKQEIINWTNKGLAQLNDVLQLNTKEFIEQGDKLLQFLINYLPANQAALYIHKNSDDNEYLERIATFAYGKKRFVNQSVSISEGLVGQCVKEKQPIVLTQVPKDYIKISSGLGEALPRFVIIQPLLNQKDVVGVLEIASFEKLEPYKLEFLVKVSENAASLISTYYRKHTDLSEPFVSVFNR